MATIIGTAGVDFLVGTTTSDLILGEDANDTLLGEAGNDELYGNAGDDLLLGKVDNDLLSGGAGNDTLFGGDGNDRLVGEDGNDFLYGDAGQDQILGGLGNDTLVGGAGRDTMTGGQGRDVFVLSNGSGGARLRAADIITDFRDRQDQIHLADGLTFRNLSITQGKGRNARNTIIRNKTTGEYLAVVQRVNASKITRRDFRLITLPAQDTAAPGVGNLAIANPNIVLGATLQAFTVQYADAVQLNSASFGIGDLLVTGPAGFRQPASLGRFTPAGNGTSRSVTYQITAPNGAWSADDNGTYQITLQGEQVFDTSGNFIPATVLGTFAVNVPIPPSPISVSVSPGSLLEDEGNALVYTFTRSGYIRNTLPVSFSLGGTAVRNTDYVLTGGTVTGNTGIVIFAANSATATVRVTPTVDNLLETNEDVVLSLVPGTGYLLTPASSATGTITDDESQVSLAIAPTSVAEDSATNELIYTFTRTGFTNRQIVVNLTLGGTATFGGANGDYTILTSPGTISSFAAGASSLTFGAGEASKTVRIKPVADALFETDETVNLAIANGTGYTLLTTSAVQGTILNDESQVTVAISPTSALEDSTQDLVYTFTRGGFTGSALTVNFSVGGTATFVGTESDYTASADPGAFTFGATSGTVSFAAGQTTRTVTINPTVDNTQEPNETVLLGVTGGTGYVVGASSTASGTILNDEGSVSLSLSPAGIAENGGTALVYTFNRSTFVSNSVTVTFTVAGTATFGTDYTVNAPMGTDFTFDGTTGTILFNAGNTSRTLRITPIGDSVLEPDETIAIALQDGTGYTSATIDPVVATIVNDDATVTLSLTPDSVAEDGSTPLTYAFNRVGATSNALTVKFNVGGTATFGSGNDYTVSGSASFNATQGTITFAPGQSTATLNVLPTVDLTTIEPDETVILTLVEDAAYTVGDLNPVQGTILNDDGVVSNTNDSGAGSLRQAILAANNSTSLATPTITFTGAALTGTINLASALPDLARSMIIDGPGAVNLTVQSNGSGNYRIFTVQNGATVTIQDLTIANGNVSGGNGGGILNNGDLTLQNSLVRGNTAALGGGIYNQNGTLTINNTRIANNTATSAEGGAGGGINVQSGTVNLVNNTSIENNVATSIGGGIANSGTLNVTGTGTSRISFSGNQATTSGGGGIYTSGITVVDFGSFENNRASPIGLGGGAILNASGTLTVGNSVFNASPLNSPNNIAGGFTNSVGNTPTNP